MRTSFLVFRNIIFFSVKLDRTAISPKICLPCFFLQICLEEHHLLLINVLILRLNFVAVIAPKIHFLHPWKMYFSSTLTDVASFRIFRCRSAAVDDRKHFSFPLERTWIPVWCHCKCKYRRYNNNKQLLTMQFLFPRPNGMNVPVFIFPLFSSLNRSGSKV